MTDGHINVCKDCRSTYGKTWRNVNADTHRVNKAIYHQSIKEEANAKLREWRKANPDKQKEQNLKHFFGITLADYNSIKESQNGVCAICELPETSKHQSGKTRDLAVDHCHTTGKIRGLLCTRCNNGIGNFKDNTEFLQKAINYLKDKGN